MKKYNQKQSSLRDYGLELIVADTLPLLVLDQNDNQREQYEIRMDAPVSMEQAITTTFVDDGISNTVSFGMKKPDDKYSGNYQSIVDFMAKPHLINQTTWHASDVANAILSSSSTPSIGSYLASVAEWANKLQGFNLCRGTAVLKLVLNATPFQAGMLLLHFLPNINERQSGTDLMYNSSLSAKVQQPSVAIDCRDSAVELRIPYVNSYNWFEIKAALHDWGNFYISVLSPLAVDAAGQQTADVSLYLSFEDFELAAPLCAQAKRPRSKVISKSEAEAEAMVGGGPVSSALRTVSNIADAVSSVPSLAAYATPVAWAADLAAGVASWFGFAKPILQTAPIYTMEQDNRYQTTTDGTDTSYSLSWRTDNTLRTLEDVSLRDEDEMSFEFLKRVETLALPGTPTSYSLSWSNSITSGTSLTTNPMYVSPTSLYFQGTSTDGAHVTTWKQGSPVFALSQMFSHWRGSFRLRMKFVKTQFHTGRLQITWTPGHTALTAPDLNTSILSLREIVDIRFCDEVSLELPYLITSPYLPISNVGTTANSYSGRLDVLVLNELRAPETVSSSIEVLMFWSAGNDFEMNGADAGGRYFPPYKAHAVPVLDSVIGDQSIPSKNCSPADECFGEYFVSVKQLLQRYTTFTHPNTLSTSQGIAWPWYAGIVGSNSSGVISTTGGDFFCLAAAMYGFYRGGMRFAIFGSTGVLETAIINTVVNASSFHPVDVAQVSITGSQFTTSSTASTQNNPFLFANSGSYSSYVVPYFSQTRMSTIQLDTTNLSTSFTAADSPTSMLAFGNGNAINTYTFARSIRDDFQFSYFIAAPPLFISIT